MAKRPSLRNNFTDELTRKFEEFESRMSALRKSADDAHASLQDVQDLVKVAIDKPPKYAEDEIVIYDACPYGHGRILYGNLIWASGVALSKFFIWRQSELAKVRDEMAISSMRVLELGAGTGVVSLALGRLGARVVASDGDAAILETLRQNIEANALQEQVLPHLLRFGESETYLADQTFDLIVAADVIYEIGSQGDRLAKALDAHVPTGSCTEIVLAHEVRDNVPLHFFDYMHAYGFCIERLVDRLGHAASVPAGKSWTAYDGTQFVMLPGPADRDAYVPGAPGSLSWLVLNASFATFNTGHIQLFRFTRSP